MNITILDSAWILIHIECINAPVGRYVSLVYPKIQEERYRLHDSMLQMFHSTEGNYQLRLTMLVGCLFSTSRSRRSVHLTTLFPKRLTSTLCTYFRLQLTIPFLKQGKGENDRRNYYLIINIHESMRPGRDRIIDPWICSQTHYRLRYEALYSDFVVCE